MDVALDIRKVAMAHGLDNDSSCALCSQCDERLDHQLLGCAYNREVWLISLGRGGWHHITTMMEKPLVA
jgi:hypothetical protein